MNVFEYKKRSSIPRRDVVRGLEVIGKNYNDNMASANQRVSDAEYKAMKAEKRAMQAEKKAEYAERKYKNTYKGNNRSNKGNGHSSSEHELAEGIVILVGTIALVGGTMLFDAVKSLMNKD